MRVLGLDLGDKTLGIAISDALRMTAQPREVFTFKTAHYKHALEYTVNYIKSENISTVVLGLPKNMNNTEGERAEISRRFAKKLEAATDAEVILWDERLSSAQVERTLIAGGVRRENRKQHIDKLAATVILQTYLDAQGSLHSQG